MPRLLNGYAVSFNRRYRQHGKLFQNRYKSNLCREDPYFLNLLRYIRLNPLRVKFVNDFTELNKYHYAGHGIIIGTTKNDRQDIDYVLTYLAKSKTNAWKIYSEHVSNAIETGKRPDLAGGGL